MARGKWGTVTNLMAYCELFPSGQEPKGFHDPVESDIPALILLGSADTQTATSWGQQAAESLEDSQVVLFPETGKSQRWGRFGRRPILADLRRTIHLGQTTDGP